MNPLSANPTKWSNTLKQFVGKIKSSLIITLSSHLSVCVYVLSKFINLIECLFLDGTVGDEVPLICSPLFCSALVTAFFC